MCLDFGHDTLAPKSVNCALGSTLNCSCILSSTASSKAKLNIWKLKEFKGSTVGMSLSVDVAGCNHPILKASPEFPVALPSAKVPAEGIISILAMAS